MTGDDCDIFIFLNVWLRGALHLFIEYAIDSGSKLKVTVDALILGLRKKGDDDSCFEQDGVEMDIKI